MNSLRFRLANIAFNVLKVAKHWKTDEEVYSVSKWQRYLDNAKKRPKVHPTVVPDESLQEAKNLKKKMQSEGKSWEEWQDAVEKKFSPEELKRKNVYETFGVNEKWNAIEKSNWKPQNKQEHEMFSSALKQKKTFEEQMAKDLEKYGDSTSAKRRVRQNHHRRGLAAINKRGGFVYGNKEYSKHAVVFGNGDISADQASDMYKKFFGDAFLSKNGEKVQEDEEQFMNQLHQFHKERAGNRRVRSNEQLKQEFIRNMKPDGYKTIKDFNDAKNRVMQMNASDFMKMVHSVFSDDDDEATEAWSMPRTTKDPYTKLTGKAINTPKLPKYPQVAPKQDLSDFDY